MTYTIGEFSRMTSLSIKSLRLYHEKGLLVPKSVDEFTGYRYFDDGNYQLARTIKILKSFEFSLAEIKEILEECEEEQETIPFLEHKLKDIKSKINQYKEISREIELTLKFERERAMHTNDSFQVEEKTVDTLLIAGYRMKGRYDECGKAFKVLGKEVGRFINGKAMNLYYDGEYKEKDADFEPCFPVRKGKNQNGISVRELKGGKCISLIHKGAYDRLGDTYKKLYDYANGNNLKIKLPTREVYIKGPGMILRGNPNNYLTEIIFMIE